MKSVPSFISINDSIITEKRANFKERLNFELKKWSLLSTAHGILPAVNPTSRIFRIIWLVCLVCSLGICVYMVYRVIALYLQWGLIVKIEEKDVNELLFPAISICNINPFVTPEAFVYLRDYYNKNYNVNITKFTDFAKMVQNKSVPYETDWIFYQTFDPNFNQTLKKSFGYSAEQRVRNCQINSKACKPSDFVWYYSPIYGNCYRYNSGYDSSGNKTQLININREGSGLSMQVFISLDDTKFPYMYQAKSKGLVIIIEDQESIAIKKIGIYNPNDFAKVSISKKVSRTLPAPYSNCQNTKDINTIFSNELKRLNIPYSRTNCMSLCEQKQIIDSLGCYDMRLPGILNAKPCRSKAEYDKINNFLFDYPKCYIPCPYECETVTFEASTSYAQYPTYNYYVNETLTNLKYYNTLYKDDNISYGEFIKGIGKVFVYYESLKYTEISSDPAWEIMDLIANVGGTLGLFLGVSLLSFVEFVELAYTMSKAFWSEYRKDREVKRELRLSPLTTTSD